MSASAPTRSRTPWPAVALTIGHALRRLASASGLVALLVLAGCGGGGTPETQTQQQDEGSASTLTLGRSGDLAAYAQRKLRARLSVGGAADSTVAPLAGGAPAPSTAVAVSAGAAAPAFASTLTQEDGVDEADLLKTDGSVLYAIDGTQATAPRLQVHRRTADGALQSLATLPVEAAGARSVEVQGLVLGDGAAAVVSQAWVSIGEAQSCAGVCPAATPPPGVAIAPIEWLASRVTVQRFDTRDPAATRAGTHLAIEGQLVDSRQLGSYLVLVTLHRPRLAPELLPASATAAQREAAISALTASDLLPKVQVNGGAAQPLLADTDCWLQTGNASTAVELTTVTVFDLRSADLARQSRCFVGGSEALYMSANALYLASTTQPYVFTATGLQYVETMQTQVHKFSLSGGSVAYRGSGTVNGHLGWSAERKAFRFSEHNGDLRVLSFTGPMGWATLADATSVPASPATLTILREAAGGGKLDRVATLPNAQRPQALGKPGEQVYGVRFVGDRGYVVTFRQVDPLYVLDLGNPADPRAAGQIELPGFSDHLQPLPGGLLLGLGRDADANGRVGGVKLALFDVADASAPRVLHSQVMGQAGSAMALDFSRHGMNLLVSNNQARIALPLMLTPQAWGTPEGGLLRLQIDLPSRSLTLKPLLAPSTDPLQLDLWRQRSVQIGEQLYWLRAGALGRFDW